MGTFFIKPNRLVCLIATHCKHFLHAPCGIKDSRRESLYSGVDTGDFSNVFADYVKFVCPAIRLSYFGRCSGGIVVLVRKCFETFAERVEVNCENTVVLKISHSLLGGEKDLLHISTYVPPAGSPYAYSTSRCLITDLEHCLVDLREQYPDCPMLCCGDLNARTSNLQVCNSLSDLVLGIDNTAPSVATFVETRVSNDRVLNEFGKSLLDMCLCLDLRVLNGFLEGDADGKCRRLVVGDRIESPHMPVEISVSRDVPPQHDVSSQSSGKVEKIVWRSDRVEEFIHELHAISFQQALDNALAMINKVTYDATE
ncbi:hypothetical protein BaRGS_00032195 [Batillaria attramentaria]|uniref:Endonuclease/exonuclease/phosphatase domain-containing protein n=1 Tax=Batillaria attramentaria TaxID=370345 RepID=A0ABD0JNT6_9CAEN